MSTAKRKHMAAAAVGNGRRRIAADLRTALSLFLVLALALQGVLAHAHVHSYFQQGLASTAPQLAAPDVPKDGDPTQKAPRGDPSSCALCQSLTAGAAPLAHEVRLFLLPAARSQPPVASVSPASVATVSFHWTSRGPPHSTLVLS